MTDLMVVTTAHALQSTSVEQFSHGAEQGVTYHHDVIVRLIATLMETQWMKIAQTAVFAHATPHGVKQVVSQKQMRPQRASIVNFWIWMMHLIQKIAGPAVTI
jgi:hypothetical protein